MVIGRMDGDGDRAFLLLGLSRQNIERLVAGKPICVTSQSHVPKDLTIAIMFGETELDIKAQLADYMQPETVIKGFPDGSC